MSFNGKTSGGSSHEMFPVFKANSLLDQQYPISVSLCTKFKHQKVIVWTLNRSYHYYLNLSFPCETKQKVKINQQIPAILTCLFFPWRFEIVEFYCSKHLMKNQDEVSRQFE